MLDRLQKDLREAQLARDEIKVSTLRLLISELSNAKIAKGTDLGEQDIILVIQKEVKKRKEAAEGFRKGNREEQAQKEETEAKILEGYLPLQLTDEELTGIIDGVITEVGAIGVSDMGRVIGAVMGKVTGQADGGRVSAKVKEKLGGGYNG